MKPNQQKGKNMVATTDRGMDLQFKKEMLKGEIEKILKQKYDFGEVCQFCGFKPHNWLTPTGKRMGVIKHIQVMHIVKMPKKSDQLLSLIKQEILRGMPKEKTTSPSKIAEAILKHPVKGFSGKNDYYPHPWVWNRVKGFNYALSEVRTYIKDLLK